MLSMASVKTASGAANYFGKDNYYTAEEAEGESLWGGKGAEMLGLVAGEEAEPAERDGAAAEPEVAGDQEAATAEQAGPSPGENGGPGAAGDKPEARTEAGTEQVQGGPAREDVDGMEVGEVDLSQVDFSDFPAEPESEPGKNAADGRKLFDNPSGKVDVATFEAILKGQLPDGTQVGNPDNRRIGMDLTFSLPKSASVLALVSGDRRILEAHAQAVKGAMSYVERNFAEARIKQDGKDLPIRTGNLVYASFAHDTSRALDPQAHIHVVIANMTRLPNGEWRSLHNQEIWRNNTVIGSVYHALMRDALEKLGYETELVGKHGAYEIKGVPEAVVKEFSQRREAILQKGSSLNIATPQGLREVTKNTRDPKLNVDDRGLLAASWRDRAAGLGFDGKQLIEASRERSETRPGWLERSSHAVAETVRETLEQLRDIGRPIDPLMDRGGSDGPRSPEAARATLAVASAVRILAQREAAFEPQQIVKTALDLGLKGVTAADAEQRITELVKGGQLIPGVSGRIDNAVVMMTTPAELARETKILNAIERGKGAVQPLVASDRAVQVLTAAAGERELNAGQMTAAVGIVSSSDRIVAVQGVAGAGKSTMLSAVAKVLEGENRPALALAFQNKMVADLAESTGLKAQTIAGFVLEHEHVLSKGSGTRFEESRKALAGGYLLVDETSMVSNEQMLDVARIAEKIGVEKLVLVGDRQQLQAIDAGKSFSLVQAGGISTSRMEENLRQRTEELRTVAALTNAGRSTEALAALGPNVIESEDRIGDASEKWLALPQEERERTSLFTSGRQARFELNEAVQLGLKQEGTLKGDGRELKVLEPVNFTREELRYSESYKPGLMLDVRVRNNDLGLRPGQYKVERVFRNGKVELKDARGGRHRLDPQKIRIDQKREQMGLAAEKTIRLHGGDRIRWTDNDKKRGLLNSSISRVVSVDKVGITVEKADGSQVRLDAGDPMLKRIDLAYTLNMHMAQGVTVDRGIVVMASTERQLANQRLFNVAVTRVRDELSVITDDKQRLGQQLDRNPGDKTSALETMGKLQIDLSASRPAGSSSAPRPEKQFDPGKMPDSIPAEIRALTIDLPDTKGPAAPPKAGSKVDPLDLKYPGLVKPDAGKPEKAAPKQLNLPLPEKSKGLEL